MGLLDGPLRDLASQLIATFSDSFATLVRAEEAVYDPVSGISIPSALQSYSVKTTPPEKFKNSEIDGTSILKTDVRVYIAAIDIAIEPSPITDTLTIGSTTYSVYRVTQHRSSLETVVLWELQLRI